jgi:hypothetical protein
MAVGDDGGDFDVGTRGFHDCGLQRNPDERPRKLANLLSNWIGSEHTGQQNFVFL